MAVSWKTPKVSLPHTIVQKGIMPYLRPGGREQQEWLDIHLRAARTKRERTLQVGPAARKISHRVHGDRRAVVIQVAGQRDEGPDGRCK